MCLAAIERRSRWPRNPSSTQRLGRKSRDNLSNTYTARKPTGWAECSWHPVRLRPFVLGALLADHWGQHENAFFATLDEAAKRIPRAVSGNVAGVGFSWSRFDSDHRNDISVANSGFKMLSTTKSE